MTVTTTPTARHEVQSYRDYADAQRAVDALADRQFPVERLTIVAEGLRFVETITGRRGYGEAAFGGLTSGGLIGALFGFIFGLFSLVDPLVSGVALAVYGLLFGAAIGLVLGLISHWLSAGRRDFSSVGSVQADRYAVLAESEELAERARAELAGSR